MAGILDLMGSIEQAGDRGRARGQQTALSRLYSQAISAPREQRTGLLSQIAAVSPEAAGHASGMFDNMDDNARADLGRYAMAFDALPDDQKAAAYPQLAQQAATMGLPVPQGEYQPQYAQGIRQLAQAFGGARGTATGVQSTYVDAQGNRVAILRDGSTQILGQNAPSNQIIDTGAGFYGVNKGNLQASPVVIGGAQPEGLQYRTSDGQPIPESEMPALNAALEAAARGESFTIPATTGQQLRSAPKAPTQLQLNADARDAERLRLAQEAAARQGQPSAAQQFKMQQTQRKEQMMLSANDAQVDGTVKLIDSILSRGKDLSGVTGIGSALSKIPGTDWADVAAMLDTLKGRSAFGALQQMRANSPTGGALGQVSERELYLLQNAETQLQNSQSPESLRRALQTYREALLESKKRMHQGVSEFYSDAPAQSAPDGVDDLLSKYGIQ